MTIREHFLTLPAPIGDLAVAACIAQHGDAVIDTPAADVGDALHTGLKWKDTPQGVAFWRDVYEAACNPPAAFPAYPPRDPNRTPDAGDGPHGCDKDNIDFEATARRMAYSAGAATVECGEWIRQTVELLALVYKAGYTKGAASK